MPQKLTIFVLALYLIFCGLVVSDLIFAQSKEASMKLASTAFSQGQPIPKKYTCSGENVSPPLAFSQVPASTQTLALIVDDPDAPGGTFDHWIVWNLPGDTRELSEGATVSKQGTNGFGTVDYKGPCPPPGKEHRYFFKVYALDTQLKLSEGISKRQLEAAMEGHILAQGELVGTYKR